MAAHVRDATPLRPTCTSWYWGIKWWHSVIWRLERVPCCSRRSSYCRRFKVHVIFCHNAGILCNLKRCIKLNFQSSSSSGVQIARGNMQILMQCRLLTISLWLTLTLATGMYEFCHFCWRLQFCNLSVQATWMYEYLMMSVVFHSGQRRECTNT